MPPAPHPDPLAGLNREQRRAASTVRGPLCILAGAGTGKTRTITHRIAHQISSGVARADQILAVTFTDKAATQLRTRLAALGVPPVRAATFHAAAWAQLRHFWSRTGEDRPLPEVLPSKVRLLVPVARRLGVEARDLAAEIEWAKSRLLPPQRYPSAASGREPPVDSERMAEVYADYEAAKAAANAIDYEDMLLRTAELLALDAEVVAAVRDRYRFLTVDEYQDVNRAQHTLLRAWVGDGDELCVVGDDDQTIYSFTGATSQYLTGFRSEFPHAAVVTLTRNYRSSQPILSLANRVLWTKPAETRKRLTSSRGEGPDPAFIEHADGDAEAGAVAARCGELIASGVSPREIAVLYRVNAQSQGFEAALRAAGLPYAVRGDSGFFARSEVRQALRLLAAERERAARPGSVEELSGVEVLPPRADQRVERVLREGLRHDAAREPEGGVARERWRNLEALLAAAARRVEDEPEVAFAVLVDDLLAQAAAGADAPDADGAITLATLHRAKGLEFDAVFLVSCEEGLLPISHARTEAEVEEERRLLYVGVTRARRHLCLSWACSRNGRTGRSVARRPSRLLYGLGEGAPVANRQASSPPARRNGSGGRRSALDDLDDDALEIGRRLRAWRADRARDDEVPAFVVASDRTLAALATLAVESPPSRPDDLLAVNGFGKVKIGRYGEEVIAVLNRAPESG